uniref:Ppx/GppA phosphatase N-terminal domain-containing protein n=1 Tax=Desulfobacca acetoxidans TaxID=60893 RepID=A0A7V4LCG7_9BACT
MPRIAAVDLGSLTVRLAVAEILAPGAYRLLCQRREITALGEGVSVTGLLSPEAQGRTLEALAGFAREMTALGATTGLGVATQAVRQAGNGREFLETAGRVLNLPVRLLSPEEEARLTLRGVLSVLAPAHRQAHPLVVFDVGGGSSEFILLRTGAEPVFAGLPLGVLSLSRAHPLGDPPAAEQLAALRGHLHQELAAFYRRDLAPHLKGTPTLVGTAGAVTTLAAMAQKLAVYDPQKVNNYILTKDHTAALAEELAALPEADRALLPGLEPAKAGVMVAGAFLILEILAIFSKEWVVVVDAGLLEGVLAELSR